MTKRPIRYYLGRVFTIEEEAEKFAKTIHENEKVAIFSFFFSTALDDMCHIIVNKNVVEGQAALFGMKLVPLEGEKDAT